MVFWLPKSNSVQPVRMSPPARHSLHLVSGGLALATPAVPTSTVPTTPSATASEASPVLKAVVMPVPPCQVGDQVRVGRPAAPLPATMPDRYPGNCRSWMHLDTPGRPGTR